MGACPPAAHTLPEGSEPERDTGAAEPVWAAEGRESHVPEQAPAPNEAQLHQTRRCIESRSSPETWDKGRPGGQRGLQRPSRLRRSLSTRRSRGAPYFLIDRPGRKPRRHGMAWPAPAPCALSAAPGQIQKRPNDQGGLWLRTSPVRLPGAAPHPEGTAGSAQTDGETDKRGRRRRKWRARPLPSCRSACGPPAGLPTCPPTISFADKRLAGAPQPRRPRQPRCSGCLTCGPAPPWCGFMTMERAPPLRQVDRLSGLHGKMLMASLPENQRRRL